MAHWSLQGNQEEEEEEEEPPARSDALPSAAQRHKMMLAVAVAEARGCPHDFP